MTTVLEKPEIADVDTSDPNRVAHRVRVEKIVDAAVFGHELTALCGHKFIPKGDPMKLPECPPCREIWDTMRRD